MTEPEAPAFEAAVKKLEEIVQQLEKGDLALEKSLKLYEEGIHLSRVCHARLDEAEGRIEQLLKDARGEVRVDAAGRPRTAPLAAPEDDSDR